MVDTWDDPYWVGGGGGDDQTDPYLALHAHVISAKALYCEDGCGLVETSGYGEDWDAAQELRKRGWAVRPHSMGGLTPLCKDCVDRYDAEHIAPTPPATTDGGDSDV